MSFSQRDYSSMYKEDDALLPSTVRGYKHWDFPKDVPKSSHYADWSTGEWTAVCGRHKDHSAPDLECTCGIYAHYLPLESYSLAVGVLGVVEASGKIVMGTKGFRAEKCKIVALVHPGAVTRWFEVTSFDLVSAVHFQEYCEKNGIQVFMDVQEMTKAFPPVALDSLGIDLEALEKKILANKGYHDSVRSVAVNNMNKNFQDYMTQQVDSLGLDKAGSKRMMETLKHLGGF